jgi:hypothetical protein
VGEDSRVTAAAEERRLLGKRLRRGWRPCRLSRLSNAIQASKKRWRQKQFTFLKKELNPRPGEKT